MPLPAASTFGARAQRDEAPLPVRMLRFDNLAADWEALIRDWRLPEVELGRVNSSGVGFERGMVSERIYGEILEYCWRDRVRFEDE